MVSKYLKIAKSKPKDIADKRAVLLRIFRNFTLVFLKEAYQRLADISKMARITG